MDLSMNLTAMSRNVSEGQTMAGVNLALMGKVLDTVEDEGQAIEKMLSSVDVAMPSRNLLDVYA